MSVLTLITDALNDGTNFIDDLDQDTAEKIIKTLKNMESAEFYYWGKLVGSRLFDAKTDEQRTDIVAVKIDFVPYYKEEEFK